MEYLTSLLAVIYASGFSFFKFCYQCRLSRHLDRLTELQQKLLNDDESSKNSNNTECELYNSVT